MILNPKCEIALLIGTSNKTALNKLAACKACEHFKPEGIFSQCTVKPGGGPTLGKIRRGYCPENKWPVPKLVFRKPKRYI